MILDSILVLGSAKAVATLTKLSEYQKGEVYILLLFNSSLLLIDHIHFQYNGFLIGLLLLCISSASCKQYIRLALFFSGLVLFKHLFAPLALVFATFLVKNYCMEDQGFNVRKFGQLVLVALGALLSAFVPFLYSYGSITVLMQIMNRLFPFGRGLVHAYWAPNVWALYCFADRVLSKATVLTNVDISDGISSTSGIVGNFQMEILPTISAFTSLLMVLIFLVPAIIRIWTSRNHEVLVCVLVYSSLSTFMVGYHVHEKAILLPLFLQTLRSKNSEEDSLLYLILSAAAVTSIFPLIPGKQEAMIKGKGCTHRSYMSIFTSLSFFSNRGSGVPNFCFYV